VAKKRDPIEADQLRNWNLLDQFRQRVLPLLQARAATATEADERRGCCNWVDFSSKRPGQPASIGEYTP